MNIFKTANKALVGSSLGDLEKAAEELAIDNFNVSLPNYGGWVTMEMDLEDSEYQGMRDNAIERLEQLELITEAEAKTLYRESDVLQITFFV